MEQRHPDRISVFLYLLFCRETLSPDTLYVEYFERKLILQEFGQQFQALYDRVAQTSGSFILALAPGQSDVCFHTQHDTEGEHITKVRPAF